MQKEDDFILEWAEHYHKHRDALFGKIKSIEKAENKLLIKYKDDSVEQLIPFSDLAKVNIKEIKPCTTIIALNTKHNFNILIEKWKLFAQIKDLKLIFFNPDSELDKRWIIKPYVHNRICDEKTLKQGLKAMFETVQAIA